MLTITVLGGEAFNEETQEFSYPEAVELELEHSLVVLQKWESKHEKPFLGGSEKTPEEVIDYVKMMIQTPGVNLDIVESFTQENFDQISAYMNAKMTATWFSDNPQGKKSSEVITAELIYYWMSSFSIPLEFEHRHINQLFTVLRIHSLKSQKPKKMSKSEALRQQRELNAQRKKELGSRG